MADQTLTQKIEDGVDVDRDEVENRIRLAAYGIWEEEGRPEGRDRDHWHEAERRAREYSARGQSDASGGDPASGAPSVAPDEAKDEDDLSPTTGADSTARAVSGAARGGRAQERTK